MARALPSALPATERLTAAPLRAHAYIAAFLCSAHLRPLAYARARTLPLSQTLELLLQPGKRGETHEGNELVFF